MKEAENAVHASTPADPHGALSGRLWLRTMPYSRAMDLTVVGWIVVGLIAGIISGIIAGGRTLRGWMPSLAIGLIAAWLSGWVLVEIVNIDPVASIYIAAVFATITAILLRAIINTVSFSED
jgi:uncharacterized membrane protein YeaQ/YmgE (transglycosylase-associated protein family)